MDIAAHIGQLVMEHECVIIPGLGGFITNYRAAELNQLQHQISPPSRTLVFNAQLNTNDGLLANFLAQRLDISYKTALLLLELFSSYCQRDLSEGKQIDFGDLGILDRNIHHKLEFYPNLSVNYNEDAFGLKALDLKKIERKSNFNLQAPILQKEERPHHTKVIKLNNLPLRRIAAFLIPFALLIGAAFYLPSFVQNKSLQQTSFFSFLIDSNSSRVSNSNIKSLDNQTDTKEFSPMTVEVIPTTEKEAEVEVINNESIPDDPSGFIVRDQVDIAPQGKFHIICGSFFDKDRADALVNQLKAEGFAAFLAGQSKSGTYRVGMESFVNINDASSQLDWVRQQGYNEAWILNKKF